jgi:hypothetical protein
VILKAVSALHLVILRERKEREKERERERKHKWSIGINDSSEIQGVTPRSKV